MSTTREARSQALEAVLNTVELDLDQTLGLIKAEPALLAKFKGTQVAEDAVAAAMTDGETKILDAAKKYGLLNAENAHEQFLAGSEYNPGPALIEWFAKNFAFTPEQNGHAIEQVIPESIQMDAVVAFARYLPMKAEGLGYLLDAAGSAATPILFEISERICEISLTDAEFWERYPFLLRSLQLGQERASCEVDGEISAEDAERYEKLLRQMCWFLGKFPRGRGNLDNFFKETELLYPYNCLDCYTNKFVM